MNIFPRDVLSRVYVFFCDLEDKNLIKKANISLIKLKVYFLEKCLIQYLLIEEKEKGQ